MSYTTSPPVASTLASTTPTSSAPGSVVLSPTGVITAKVVVTTGIPDFSDWVTTQPTWSPVALAIGDRVLTIEPTSEANSGLYIINAAKQGVRAPEANTAEKLMRGLTVLTQNADALADPVEYDAGDLVQFLVPATVPTLGVTALEFGHASSAPVAGSVTQSLTTGVPGSTELEPPAGALRTDDSRVLLGTDDTGARIISDDQPRT